MAEGRDELLGLVGLSVVDDGDSVVIGNPQAGVFFSVPPVGGVVVRALQAGASVAEAAAAAEQFAGQPVNVAGFVDRLRGLGLIGGAAGGGGEPKRTAAIQQRRWLRGPESAMVAWLFGRAAWAVYAGAAAGLQVSSGGRSGPACGSAGTAFPASAQTAPACPALRVHWVDLGWAKCSLARTLT